MSSDEDDFSTNDTSISNRRQKCNDDDLFSRAAELNTSPLTVKSSEVEITLQTDETACEYRHM